MLLTTFLLTVLVDLTVAIEVGMVLAAFLFMRRMAEATNSSPSRESCGDGDDTTYSAPGAISRRDHPAPRRGLRDQRPVLLWGGRGVQGNVRPDRRASRG